MEKENHLSYFLGVFALMFLATGIFLRKGRLYLYDYGVIQEDTITLGLSRLFEIKNPPFYELNTFLLFSTLSIYIIAIIFLSKVNIKTHFEFDPFPLISSIFVFIPVVICIVNFEKTVPVSPDLKPYSMRYLSTVDDLISTNYRMMIQLDTKDFMISLSSIVISLIAFLIRILKINYDSALFSKITK